MEGVKKYFCHDDPRYLLSEFACVRLTAFTQSVVSNSATPPPVPDRVPQVYPDPHPDFMFSENLFEVAERGGCGYKRGSGFPLHFTKSFSKRVDDYPHYVYSTRRVW